VALFVAVAVAMAVSLWRNQPALVIDPDALQAGSRRVAWTEVTDVTVSRSRMVPSPMLSVHLGDGRPIRVLLRDLDRPTPEILQEIDRFRR